MARLRELPRAGLALHWRDLVAAYRERRRAESGFPAAFARWLEVEEAHVVSSGRAALCLMLRAMAELSSRREVIVPAYTCPTVPLAVARAGLSVRLCDVDPTRGNLGSAELAEVISDATLAVMAVHMHGIPCEMGGILAAARGHGAAVVEDCAAAAGARLDGRRVGSFGDAAFFSLARGKGFTAYEGGIAVGEASKRCADAGRRPGRELATLVKLLAMFVFFHPRLYWMVRALPLGWETEEYELDFPITRVGAFRQGVALSVLGRLDRVVAARRERARQLAERLRGLAGVRLLEAPPTSEPAYPWLPLWVEQRDEALRRLRAEGLGAAPLFTRSLNQYDYLRGIVSAGSHPAAEALAKHLISLPTHAQVGDGDADAMVRILSELE